jgi:glycosyltransferase involved in cell wall biosynthesis
MQYIWTLYDDYVSSLSAWKQQLFKRVTPRLRHRDQKDRTFDHIMTNSYATQELCHTVYGRRKKAMKVVYPPLDPRFFTETTTLSPDKYFIYIGRLSIFAKHLDVIINLCNLYKVQLLIAGDGPDKEYLMSIA